MPIILIVLRIAFIIFAVDILTAVTLLMLVAPLSSIGIRGEWTLSIIDVTTVVLISSYLIYCWVIKPYIAGQRQAEVTLREAIESISEGFLMFDADDRLALCNTKFRELYAVASDVFVAGRKFEDILRTGVERGQYPEATGNVENWIAERITQHRNPGEAIERLLPNGRWVKITEARTSTGNTVGVRADITELKTREQLTRDSEERLRQIVDSLQEGFVLFDREDRLVMWNEKWFKIRKGIEDVVKAGMTFEDILRISVSRMLYPEAFGREEEFIADRIHQHQNPGPELIRQHRDGRWYIIREAPTAEGGIFGISIDITDLKIAENLAQEARLQAERADKSKSEFLANMSHELRTPLNAIIGFSEVIEKETFGPVGSARYRSYAKDINHSGQHLLALISDILDLSKVESGKDDINEDTVDVVEITRSAVNLVRQNAHRKGVKLELQVRDDLPELHADERKLMQILINLLTNAIKFTPANGTVTLKAYCDAHYGYVFQLADTGIGISPENIPKAMSQFGQVENTLSREAEGSGLGLPLTKALVELHGGSLAIQSEVGVGTTVTVRLPTERILEQPARDTQPPAA